MGKNSNHDLTRTAEVAEITELEALSRAIEILRTSAEKFLHNHIEAEYLQYEDTLACEKALDRKVEVIKNLRHLINPALKRTSVVVDQRISDMISSFEIIVETEVAAAVQFKKTGGKITFLLPLLMINEITPENKNPKSQLDKLIEELEELEQSTE